MTSCCEWSIEEDGKKPLLTFACEAICGEWFLKKFCRQILSACLDSVWCWSDCCYCSRLETEVSGHVCWRHCVEEPEQESSPLKSCCTVSKVLGNLKNDADVMSWSRLSSVVTTCLYSHWGSRSTDNINFTCLNRNWTSFQTPRDYLVTEGRTSLCQRQIGTDTNWLIA